MQGIHLHFPAHSNLVLCGRSNDQLNTTLCFISTLSQLCLHIVLIVLNCNEPVMITHCMRASWEQIDTHTLKYIICIDSRDGILSLDLQSHVMQIYIYNPPSLPLPLSPSTGRLPTLLSPSLPSLPLSPLSGPIGLVCLLTAKACGAAEVIVTGQ